jgi:hypothetical protein
VGSVSSGNRISGEKAVDARDRKVSNRIGRYYDCMELGMDFRMRISHIREFRGRSSALSPPGE